ncbi:MAG: AI-2E family transporter [Pseudomonadota bacterium]
MRKDRVTESQLRIATTSMVILAGIAIGAILWIMRPVLVPLVLAILLSYLLMPLVDFLQVHLKIPRVLAVTGALLLSGLALLGLALVISSSVQGLAAKAPEYQAKLVQLGQRALEVAEGWGIPVDEAVVRARLSDLPVAEMMVSTVNALMSSFSTFFLILIFVIYLLSGRTPHHHRTGILKEMEARIRDYISVKVFISFLTGVLTAVVLFTLGLDLAIVFGLLAFLLNFIPSIGSVISMLLPLPVALMQFDGGTKVLLVLLIPGAIQMVLGNVIEPKMMGETLNLHPITVLLSLIFWGMLWGMAGMVLAAPITAVIAIILERMDQTRSIAHLMAGKVDW